MHRHCIAVALQQKADCFSQPFQMLQLRIPTPAPQLPKGQMRTNYLQKLITGEPWHCPSRFAYWQPCPSDNSVTAHITCTWTGVLGSTCRYKVHRGVKDINTLCERSYETEAANIWECMSSVVCGWMHSWCAGIKQTYFRHNCPFKTWNKFVGGYIFFCLLSVLLPKSFAMKHFYRTDITSITFFNGSVLLWNWKALICVFTHYFACSVS